MLQITYTVHNKGVSRSIYNSNDIKCVIQEITDMANGPCAITSIIYVNTKEKEQFGN